MHLLPHLSILFGRRARPEARRAALETILRHVHAAVGQLEGVPPRVVAVLSLLVDVVDKGEDAYTDDEVSEILSLLSAILREPEEAPADPTARPSLMDTLRTLASLPRRASA